MNYLVQGPFHGDDDFNVLFVPLTPCYYTLQFHIQRNSYAMTFK